MKHRGLQIGGTNCDKLLGLCGNEYKTNIHRRTELATGQIKNVSQKENIIWRLIIIFADEIGPISKEEISWYDIILRKIRNSTTFLGGILIIKRLFQKSSFVIPYFKMISLKHSVWATGSEYIQL